MNVHLTPTELEILKHRLDVPDALADAIAEENGFEWDDVSDTAERLSKRIELDHGFVSDQLTVLERIILIDCLDGSTFFGSAEDAVGCGEVTASWNKSSRLQAWRQQFQTHETHDCILRPEVSAAAS